MKQMEWLLTEGKVLYGTAGGNVGQITAKMISMFAGGKKGGAH